MGYRSVLPKFFSCLPRSHKGCLLYSLFLVFLELRFFYLVSFTSRLFLCSVTSYQTRWNLPNSAFFSTHFVGDSPILVTSIYLFVFHSVLFSFCSYMDVKIVPFFSFFFSCNGRLEILFVRHCMIPTMDTFHKDHAQLGCLRRALNSADWKV